MESNNTITTCKPEQDNGPPGGVYLCQVDSQVSCGACCGLYNVEDASPASMASMLRYRTEQFSSVPRTVVAIDDFAHHLQSRESQERPFPQFHHCPFIGLIGEQRSRVGCLLHPQGEGNNGVDFRGLSYYGGLACRTYFCPATRELAPGYKHILRTVFSAWHLYGLIVTEKELVTALFKEIEIRLNHPLEVHLFNHNQRAAKSLVALFDLKLTWPHRPPEADTPCHHFFFDVQYSKPAITYDHLGTEPSRYHTILKELVSRFETDADLRNAEQLLERRIAAVVDSI